MTRPTRLPKLPSLLDRKIYKTGQTRGADDDVIFQNRVSRNSTVLIPFSLWEQCRQMAYDYENGFIVLISPDYYFLDTSIEQELQSKGLFLGTNTLVFYETRAQWNSYNPENYGWIPADQRISPLGGQYLARVAATTASENGAKINRGFTATAKKGAGIRVYEYASLETITSCRLQLEALFWLCRNSQIVAVGSGMSVENALIRKEAVFEKCKDLELLDVQKLTETRTLNTSGATICPLCLAELPAEGFISRMSQAEGREVHDLTVTQINLFHIQELKAGIQNHRPYNLGWGHHHCNVVVKDSGIIETLQWMQEVVERNIETGHLPKVIPSNNAS